MSADGTSIVFGSIREGDFDIYTMNPDGIQHETLDHQNRL